MIDQILTFVTDELAKRIAIPNPQAVPIPVLANPARIPQDASLENRLIVSLAGLEREPMAANSPIPTRPRDGTFAHPPLQLTLLVTLAANYPENYPLGLKVLSNAIRILHEHPQMTRQSHPDLPAGLQDLSIEWHDTQGNAAHAPQGLSDQMLPFAMYKIRSIAIDENGADISIRPVTKS